MQQVHAKKYFVAARETSATAGVDVIRRIWIVQVDVVAVEIAIGMKGRCSSRIRHGRRCDFHVWVDLMSALKT
jgi:hypothetical protein